MKAQLKGLGRHKFTGTVTFSSYNGLMKKIKQHLMSKDVDLEFEDGSSTAQVIVGGFRSVGSVELHKAVFRCVTIEDAITYIDKTKK